MTGEESVTLDSPAIAFVRISPAEYGLGGADYFLSDTEVTNGVFAEFLRETGKFKGDEEVFLAVEQDRQDGNSTGRWSRSTAPIYTLRNTELLWSGTTPPDGTDDFPVAMISIEEAVAFCAWLTSKHADFGTFRLPTVEEWLVAAYGSNRQYPWGNEWDDAAVHHSIEQYDSLAGADEFLSRLARAPDAIDDVEQWYSLQRVLERQAPGVELSPEPVRARPTGRTPEGLYGMLGNVSEYIENHSADEGGTYVGVRARWRWLILRYHISTAPELLGIRSQQPRRI